MESRLGGKFLDVLEGMSPWAGAIIHGAAGGDDRRPLR